MCYLTRHRLSLRGHGNDQDSNFKQNFTSTEIQNEILREMS